MLYQGSKARIGAKIAEIIKYYRPGRRFVEPFCGGLNLTQYINGARYCSDINPYLIAMWRKILIDDWLGPDNWDEDYYKTVRDNKDTFPPEIVGWVGFCSFGGSFFNGQRGLDYPSRDFTKEYQKNFLKQKEKLQGVFLRCCQYHEVDLTIPSVIYCDPPYYSTKAYTHTFDHFKFWEWCRLKSQEHIVLVSEYSAPRDFKLIWATSRKSGMRLGESSSHQENLYIHESQYTGTFFKTTRSPTL